MVTATRVIVVVQTYTLDYTCNLPDYMCNPPDYMCKLADYTQAKYMEINHRFTVICHFTLVIHHFTVIHCFTVICWFTTCNPLVYERPFAEDIATFFSIYVKAAKFSPGLRFNFQV